MAGPSDSKEGKGKKRAPKPPPKPRRADQRSLISRDGAATPLKKGSLDNHHDDFPRFRAKVRSVSSAREREDPCFTCLRTAVHCYNIVILLLGLGVLGVGIWLLVTEYSAREVSVLVGSNFFEIGTYLLIAGGGTIALMAFCGCCGTMREDRCVLAFYGIVLTLVLLALVTGSILAFVFRSKLSDQIKDHLVHTVTKQYGVDLRSSSENRLITDAWDSMQRSLQCCGAWGDVNGDFSWAIYKDHSAWKDEHTTRVPLVPDSCCGEDKGQCTGSKPVYGPPMKGPPMLKDYVENEHLYTEGCYDKLSGHLENHALILGGIGACVPLLLVIGIIVVFCMCAKVPSTDEDDEDDV